MKCERNRSIGRKVFEENLTTEHRAQSFLILVDYRSLCLCGEKHMKG